MPVDLETGDVLPPGKMGMLLVSGPSVFNGYLGDEASPFEERQGKRWYVTGDLVEIDRDGFIYFRGRLKRFLKAGGEMISLPALEEPFTRRYPPDENGPRVAVEGVETESGRNIVLFTTEPITIKEANALLFEVGFRGVMRLDEVRRLDTIPVLGTGKIDYRPLRAMITTRLGLWCSPRTSPANLREAQEGATQPGWSIKPALATESRSKAHFQSSERNVLDIERHWYYDRFLSSCSKGARFFGYGGPAVQCCTGGVFLCAYAAHGRAPVIVPRRMTSFPR